MCVRPIRTRTQRLITTSHVPAFGTFCEAPVIRDRGAFVKCRSHPPSTHMFSRPQKTRSNVSGERVKLSRIVLHQIATNVFPSPRKGAQALFLSPPLLPSPARLPAHQQSTPTSTQPPSLLSSTRATCLSAIQSVTLGPKWRAPGRICAHVAIGRTRTGENPTSPSLHRAPPAFVAEFERLMTGCSDTAMRCPATTSSTSSRKSSNKRCIYVRLRCHLPAYN